MYLHKETLSCRSLLIQCIITEKHSAGKEDYFLIQCIITEKHLADIEDYLFIQCFITAKHLAGNFLFNVTSPRNIQLSFLTYSMYHHSETFSCHFLTYSMYHYRETLNWHRGLLTYQCIITEKTLADIEDYLFIQFIITAKHLAGNF